MGYLHIDNLYRTDAQDILKDSECYALEKVHGTSSHVSWNGSAVSLSSGGESAVNFAKLFDIEQLTEKFGEMFGGMPVVVYGEAYGGKQQGMSDTYGKELKFIAFDVMLHGGTWCDVPAAAEIVERLGLEFVPYRRVSTDLSVLDAERDRPSEVAVRRGITEPRQREGVVLRPLVEAKNQYGERVIAKHKGDNFRETKTSRKVVVDPAAQAVLTDANKIADEWVVPERLRHVLAKMSPAVTDMRSTPEVIAAMIEDVLREGRGEIVDSKEARNAIGKRTAVLLKQHFQATLAAR